MFISLTIKCDEEYRDILIAELGNAGFDTFLETADGFEAYVEDTGFQKADTEEVLTRYSGMTTIAYSFGEVEKKNWNEEWEKNYEPILVDDRCLIRAHFHQPSRQYPYEIIITPKMSFGTGHHQTTHLMIKNQMSIDHNGKRVMDAGCGTAILAIMACKLGAREVEAFDIDEWSVVNGNENIGMNACSGIHLQRGKLEDFAFQGKFDLILANINKNVLLAEMKSYSGYLAAGGQLLLSGFYVDDIDDLLACAAPLGLSVQRRDERERWACLLLKKS